MLNKCEFIGNLGADPEIRQAGSAQVANLRLAVGESWKKDGKWVEKTEWINFVVWNKYLIEKAQRLQKGMRIYVCGKLRTREWESDTGARKMTEIVLDAYGGELIILDKVERGDAYEPDEPF